MDELKTLLDFDISILVLIAICGLGVVAYVIQQSGIIKKHFGIKTKSDIEHELIVQTSQDLATLQKQHVKDMEEFQKRQDENVSQSIAHDKVIREELQAFTTEVRDAINLLNAQMEQYNANRVHDRAQSFEIQKQLNDRSDDRDKKIEALMLGSMELLGDKIDQRFSRYVALDGIPENEVEEFDGIFAAYRGLGGNHKRAEKYKYVKEHMKVIPVESKLKNKN